MKCEWRYFIVLNNDKEDIVEGKEVPGDGIPVVMTSQLPSIF